MSFLSGIPDLRSQGQLSLIRRNVVQRHTRGPYAPVFCSPDVRSDVFVSVNRGDSLRIKFTAQWQDQTVRVHIETDGLLYLYRGPPVAREEEPLYVEHGFYRVDGSDLIGSQSLGEDSRVSFEHYRLALPDASVEFVARPLIDGVGLQWDPMTLP
jgi:hypothetical protein